MKGTVLYRIVWSDFPPDMVWYEPRVVWAPSCRRSWRLRRRRPRRPRRLRQRKKRRRSWQSWRQRSPCHLPELWAGLEPTHGLNLCVGTPARVECARCQQGTVFTGLFTCLCAITT
eukprot:6214136-Prymnesium_polylepis.2